MIYLLVAVEDGHLDKVAQDIDDTRWTRGVRQVVLDGIEFDEAERVSH